MNAIQIVNDESGKAWVLGSTLCVAISHYTNPADQFSRWAEVRVKPFQEGVDYLYFKKYPNPRLASGESNRQFVREYKFSLPAAIQLAKAENKPEVVSFLESIQRQPVEVQTVVGPTLFNASPQPVKVQPEVRTTTPQINVSQNTQLGLVVSARDLFGKIAPPRAGDRDNLSDLVNTRIRKFDLQPGVDFIKQPRPSFDFVLTLKTAKLFAKIQSGGKGMDVYTYLKNYEAQAQAGESSDPVTSDLVPEVTSTIDHVKSIDDPKPAVVEPLINQSLPEVPQQLPPLLSTAPKPASTPLTAFQELMQQMQIAMDNEALIRSHAERLGNLEQVMSNLAKTFQQIATMLFGILPVGSPLAEKDAVESQTVVNANFEEEDFAQGITDVDLVPNSTRSKLVRIVNDYVEAKAATHQDVWRWLYGQLNETHRFNVSRHKTAKENYLDATERNEQLENLYTIANTTLVPTIRAIHA